GDGIETINAQGSTIQPQVAHLTPLPDTAGETFDRVSTSRALPPSLSARCILHPLPLLLDLDTFAPCFDDERVIC
ncbi:hypothetical protein, partial [Pseudomonas aeruginosa]